MSDTIDAPILVNAARDQPSIDLSGSTELFRFMKRRAKAWVRANGTRAGISAAYAALRPHLLAGVEDFEALGGQRFDASVIDEVTRSVAKYWSKAGWGYFVRRGKHRGWIFDGKGAHPRGPERPHLRETYFSPRREAALAAFDQLQKAGYPHPTQRQVIDRVRSTTGLDISRASARGWIDENPRTTAALDALPAVDAALARALREQFKTTKIYVLALADIASKLWQPSGSESTRRVHRKRARDAMLRIGATRVGINVAIVGDSVIVGRHRSIPADPAAYVEKATIRKLRCGMLNSPGTQATQDRAAAEEMIGFIGAWIEDVEHATGRLANDEVRGEENGARVYVRRLVEDGTTFAGDLSMIADPERRAIMQIMENSGTRTWIDAWRCKHDHSLAATMGVLPRDVFHFMSDGRETRVRVPDHDARKAEHLTAFGGLACAYGRGECLGGVYRRVHRTGALPMQRFARRIAEALTGIYDVDAALAALPALTKPGRDRRHPNGEAIFAARSGRPVRVVLAATRRPESKVPPVHPKMRVDTVAPLYVIPPQPAEYEVEKEGIPWFFVCG